MVQVERDGPISTISINRPEARNAVDRVTAQALSEAMEAFDQDDTAAVAVLTGAGTTFCAGADLMRIGTEKMNRVEGEGDGPMGPSRRLLSKPVIAAIEGHAVAGGLELALWCDLRVIAEDAIVGVFCRRFGVPLIDGGTIRLPRLIGLSRALDLILTGRPVDANEALSMGLVNRVVAPGTTLETALVLARQLASFPQVCMRNDRLSAYEQFSMGLDDALANEFRLGVESLASEELQTALHRFKSGSGRHGRFDD